MYITSNPLWRHAYTPAASDTATVGSAMQSTWSEVESGIQQMNQNGWNKKVLNQEVLQAFGHLHESVLYVGRKAATCYELHDI